MFTALFDYISQFKSFTREEKAIIESCFTVRQVPKKFNLIKKGKIARELYFINKGLLRLYYSHNGEDITAFIFREHLFASCYESFLCKSPAIQSLDTLEDSELLVISYDDLQILYKRVPKMETVARNISDQRFLNAQRILSSYIIDSPEERWINFEATQGDLLLRVPHHMIASFLGITPVSLSRIRKRLMDGA